MLELIDEVGRIFMAQIFRDEVSFDILIIHKIPKHEKYLLLCLSRSRLQSTYFISRRGFSYGKYYYI